MRPSRVGYVLNTFPKLSETFIAGELAELRRRGVEIRILSRRQSPDQFQHAIIAEAGLAERTTYDRTKFSDVLRTFRPQILHAHFATGATAAARTLAEELGIPFTFTAHGYDIYRRPPQDFADRAAAAAAVVTVSEANAAHIVKTFGVPAHRLRIVRGGVDTGRFRPSGVRPAPPNVVCVARLSPVKNHQLLLEACAILRCRGMAFRCVLVGDGPLRPEVEATRLQLDLEDTVQLVGAAEQADVLAWWQRATIGVLTSDSEGLPVCLMEAAACGVPTVATAVGGVPELVRDGVTGLLVPAGEPLAVADALERLLRDEPFAQQLGVAARQWAVERFSVTRQVEQLLDLWSEVLEGAAPAQGD